MIHLNCNKRGSGKTKALISTANEMALNAKGDLVYIDDDPRPIYELDRKIRFINSSEYELNDYKDFYGFLCGIMSENYDIEKIFIDGLLNIVKENCLDNAGTLFEKIEKLSQKYNVELYININTTKEEIPEFMKKYVA
jgi:hypothetical protein